MTAPILDVDWAAVDRPGRRLQWWTAPGLAASTLAYGAADGWGAVLGLACLGVGLLLGLLAAVVD